MKLTLAQLQARGWVTQTQQLSHGIAWGYKILRYNGQLGCMAFGSQVYSLVAGFSLPIIALFMPTAIAFLDPVRTTVRDIIIVGFPMLVHEHLSLCFCP